MAEDLNSAPAETDDLRASLEAAFSNPEPAADAAPEIPAGSDDPIAEQAAREYSRDEAGRFAPADKAAEKPVEAQKAPEAAKPAAPEKAASEAPQAAPEAHRPPPGWSPAAKAAFGTLPAEVQAAVFKREQEVNQGFAKLAEYKPLEQYVEMAKRGGTTLDRALEQYVGIENALRTNLVEGFTRISQNIGVHPVEMAQQILAAYGQPHQTGQTGQPQAQPAAPQAATPDVRSIVQQELQGVQRQAQIDAALEGFFSDPANVYAENVTDTMLPLVSQRRQENPNEPYAQTLKWAYEKACWAHDEVRPLLIKQQWDEKQRQTAEAANQARSAARSITGSPIPGASPGESLPADDVRSALVAAWQQHGGRV